MGRFNKDVGLWLEKDFHCRGIQCTPAP
jgi:hypothetical protein